jgi:hypothetical protein
MCNEGINNLSSVENIRHGTRVFSCTYLYNVFKLQTEARAESGEAYEIISDMKLPYFSVSPYTAC